MKMNADLAGKTVKNIQAEIQTLLAAESENRTYSYGVHEEPVIPDYSFAETQDRLHALQQQAAAIRHAINVFNITTILPGYEITVDEGLGKMSRMNEEKKRLYELLQIPEKKRQRSFAGKDADYIVRNYDIREVEEAYDQLCLDLMRLQQAINIANLTIEIEVPVEERFPLFR